MIITKKKEVYMITISIIGLDPYLVRQISKEYYSDNYMIKKCAMCGKEYHTFSHLSKYCDKCKDLLAESTKDWWKTWVKEDITPEDVVSWGYNSWNDFWESNI